MHPEAQPFNELFYLVRSIFLDLMEYANQMQELTERLVSNRVSGYIYICLLDYVRKFIRVHPCIIYPRLTFGEQQIK